MKIEQINVKPVDDSILWLVHDTENNEYRKEIAINVDDSCEALLVMSNGSPIYLNSGKHDIPWAKYNKLGNAIKKIVGVVRHSTFDMKFALNQGIPFKDEEAGLTPRVNVTCDCKCKITDSYKLYLEHKSPNQLNVDEVRNKLFSECQTSLITNLAKALENYTYYTIDKDNKKLSDSIKQEIQPILPKYGINLESCNVTKIFFIPSEGYDDYNEERAKAIAEKNNKKEQKRQQESDRIFISKMQQQSKEQQPQQENKCGRCGKVSPKGTRFCPVCGKQLN